jgi:uncharacterized protein YbcI
MATTEQHPTGRGEMLAAISNAVVRCTHEYTGRGPTKARTYMQDDTVTTYLADTLTKGERVLADRGQQDQVCEMRRAFQRAMRDDLCAEIEKITGRRVIAFFSDNHIDPDMAVEGFALAPQSTSDNTDAAST